MVIVLWASGHSSVDNEHIFRFALSGPRDLPLIQQTLSLATNVP